MLLASLIAAAALGAFLSSQWTDESEISRTSSTSPHEVPADNEPVASTLPEIKDVSDAKMEETSRPEKVQDRERLEKRHEEVRLGLSWDTEPTTLRVYQSTDVRLWVREKPAAHQNATCEWFFDGTSKVGCDVMHTFEGGLADVRVRLRLVDGDWSHESTRIIPLERLEVVAGLGSDSLASADIPEPKRAERAFRFAVIADSAAEGGVPAGVRRGISSLKDRVRPELVFHLGGLVTPNSGELGWDRVNESMASPLRQAGIHTLWGMNGIDTREGARVRPPELELIDGKDYPVRYTFSYKGAFFLCFSVSGADGADEATLRWLKATLEKAKIYDSRFVMTYLPLNKFTERHLGSHKKKMRLYEILLRARVTGLFTGAYRVYFKGRYGVLDVVSTGALAGTGGKLSGTNLSQKSSFTVVDVEEGAMKTIFAVEGPDFDQTIDETILPDSVEVYTR